MLDIHQQHIVEENLSVAWAKAFLATAENPEVSPLTVTVTGFESGRPAEDDRIRTALDQSLKSNGLHSCETVAGTIFPSSLWNPQLDRSALFDRYLKILPSIRKCKGNHNGVYFERLINYKPGGEGKVVNQLDYIISTYKAGNHRRSALQASIFNPARDATNQRQRGFPCLQQVGFTPNPREQSMAVSGYYPMEYIYVRGYGNYLGLCRLGQFVAHQLGLEMTKMTCFVGVGKPGEVAKKKNLRALAENIRAIISD
ncbi:MAG: thymidylate synthase [Candidatus Nealsonbacteria bacterium]|nr:thymidylate synthase [Candidatus Nealsonbacteria bacterium]